MNSTPEIILTMNDDTTSPTGRTLSGDTSNQQQAVADFLRLEAAMNTCRPSLVRFARSRGVSADALEDVVQETLLEAWQHLHRLDTFDSFEAWLRGICRNVCRRWATTHATEQARNAPLLYEKDNTGVGFEERILDPYVLDPIEELNRQDLSLLLSRALGYLPDATRMALELHYLAELPHQEAAARLGLTMKALEMRLYRARRQLRHILNNELRTEAEDFGLTLDQEAVPHWRETRIWCMFCARYHLQGRLETQPNGQVSLHLRCPGCIRTCGAGWIETGATDVLRGVRSLRPALNRILSSPNWISEPHRHACSWCKSPVQTQLSGPQDLHYVPPLPYWPGLRWLQYCSSCGGLSSCQVGLSVLKHPLAQSFIAQHPRWINEPEALVNDAGISAIRVRLTDLMSADQLTLLVDSSNGLVLTALDR
jgi:RNA polymerase sigma factor (sigma-70 family)